MADQDKNSNTRRQMLWLGGLGLLSACLISSFFLTLSWLAGGDSFMRTLNGHEALVLSLTGAALGLVLALTNRSAAGTGVGQVPTEGVSAGA